MAKTDKPPKKKARLAAIENGLLEIQEQLRELDRKVVAHTPEQGHLASEPVAPHDEESDEGISPHSHAELNERLARLESKLDTLIEGLAQVEAGRALRGESQGADQEGDRLES